MGSRQDRKAIRDEVLDTIAEAFVFGEGDPDEEAILALWEGNADADLAAQAIARWHLDEGYSQWWEEFSRDPSHMERYGYDAADLAEAFARLRVSWRERLRLRRAAPKGGPDEGTRA
ncbi:hypothetical protein [Elioraea thermophila]|uniref:hypothetical protein n=1 Tax=Elioraea thermophila TaxID=2185104 RepID=UPI000DF3B100|nr:hypothetical protein [Elioraea thermophila]